MIPVNSLSPFVNDTGDKNKVLNIDTNFCKRDTQGPEGYVKKPEVENLVSYSHSLDNFEH
jgi:hypothetical protein